MKLGTILCFLAAMIPAPAFADTNVSGTISVDTTWGIAGSPYVVTGSVTVANLKTLTIEPGVIVRFNAGTGLTINGKLSAVGTSEAGITFTSSSATPTRGSWRELDFQTGTNPSSQLTYVTIAYGGYVAGGGSNGQALQILNGTTDLDHVTVTESAGLGIYARTTAAMAINSVSVSNCNSDGLRIEGYGGQSGLHSITDSTFTANGGYGINFVVDSRATITNTSLTNNTGYAIGAQPSTDIHGLTGLTVTGNGGGAKNAIEYRWGTVSARDETWRAGENLPYVLTGGANIANGRVLTIVAGSTVKFGSATGMTIYGKLSAVGTSEAGITFTSSSATPARGSWRELDFQTGANPKSQLSYVTIAYGGYVAGGGSNGYALQILNGTTDLDHVTVRESLGMGIYARTTAAMALNSVTVSNCNSDGLRIEGYGGQSGLHAITNSAFTANGGYGINFVVDSRATITNTSLTNNTGYAIGAQPHTDIHGLTGLTVSGNGAGAKNAIEYRWGTISTRDETWRAGGNLPYVLPGGVRIASGRVLTIVAGSTIRFGSPTAAMTVNGKLSAVGTSESQITFTSSAATPARGSWANLLFESGTNPASELGYATVSHGGHGGYALRIVNGTANLNHVTVTESSTVGIESSTTGAPSLSSVTVSNCTSHGIVLNGWGTQTGLHSITDSTFTANGGYGIDFREGGRATITNTSLTNNTGYAIGAQPHTDIQGLTGLTVSGNGAGAKNAIEYRWGTISARDEVWRAGENLPYVLPAGTTIANGRTLTIVEGSTLKFSGPYGLTVKGKLSAVGTSTARITFTASAASPARGAWLGLELHSGTNPASELAYVTVAYAGAGGYGVQILSGTASLSHVTVTESGAAGIDSRTGSSPTFSFVTVSNSTSHGMVIQDWATQTGVHTISDSSFSGNGGYGLYANTVTPVVVKHSSFTGNASGGATASSAADMRMCHWGAAGGPAGSGFGTGQSVNAKIAFEPWLTTVPTSPHQFTSAVIKNRTFNPVNASWKGTFSTPDAGSWIATIRNASDAVIRTLSGSGASTGEIAWDGRDGNGVVQANGNYSWTIDSNLAGQNAAPVRGRAIVDSNILFTVSDLSATPPAFSPNGDGVSDAASFSASTNYDGASWTLIIEDAAGINVRSVSGEGAQIVFLWDGRNDSGALLPDGNHVARLSVSAGGPAELRTREVLLDNTAPLAVLSSPAASQILSNVSQSGATDVPILGTAQDANLDNWILDYAADASPSAWTTIQTGATSISNGQLAVWETLPLSNGGYTLRLRAWDRAGTQSTASIAVSIANQELLSLSIQAPSTTMLVGQSVQFEAIGTYTSASSVNVTPTVQWESSVPAVASVTSGLVSGLSIGSTTISIGLQSISDSVVVTIESSQEPLPPDPATVAPPLDPAVPTTTFHSTRFLYEGSDPIQTNVVAGAIEPARAMVIRGRLIQANGQALPGVRISIKDRTELGETLSRLDGRFDFVANGGGLEILRLEKAGYISADRQIPSDWAEDVHTGDIALIPYDGAVTQVNSNDGAMQVARGSVMSDADGSRRATLLFAPGTEAVMHLPSGGTQSMASLAIRATEYTVGDTGRAAMPADLPPQSGYTYCVELSADEAVGAGATSITFSKPVVVYLENFLGFPVGGAVPAGYYDREQSAWIPSDDGRVVKILGIELGLAYLDVTGSGIAADPPTLAAMGITDAEREKLAQMYGEGQTLWRVRGTHFTPWDFNWPPGVGATPGAAAPSMSRPSSDSPLARPDLRCGSIIDCQNQALGEAFSIVGTPISLHYNSKRMPGRTLPFTLDIPVSGATLPPGVLEMVVDVTVAGKKYSQKFPPSVNQSYAFTWNGEDVYGRKTQGVQPAKVRISYVYQGVYQAPANLTQSFGAFSAFPISQTPRAGVVVALSQDHSVPIGAWDAGALGLGGWSASLVHTYDPQSRMLYLGTGEDRSATASGNVITPFAGTGVPAHSGDGGSALDAQIGHPFGLAVAKDGSVFIADGMAIRKVAPDGTISTVAGNGTCGFSGDGGPATAAQLCSPEGVAVAPDGTIYIADSINDRIRKVAPDGTISTFAGNGVAGFSGDGGPATSASLRDPSGVAVGPDGSVYIADEDNHRIRRVSQSGIITTVAGGPSWGYEGDVGDGGPASEAKLYFPEKIAVGKDGVLYIPSVGGGRIRRVGVDGIISTIAGDGTFDNFELEGVPATSVSVEYPYDLAVDSKGSVFYAEPNMGKIFEIRTDGILVRAAGDGRRADDGDYGPPRSAAIKDASTLAMAPNGDLYVAGFSTARVRKISRAFPGLGAGEIFVPSESGGEIFVFNEDLRHVRTVDSLTSVVIWSFGYDAAGRLVTITGRDGEITQIERSGSGAPTAIVAPRGQRTTLTLSPAGLIASITDPAGETRQFTYDAGGLLTTYTSPNQHQTSFQYDSDGRLTRHDDPAGGSMTLARSGTARDFLVTLTTAEGRTTLYDVEELPTGLTRLRNTAPSGLTTESLAETSGARTVSSPSGMVLSETLGPDTRFGIQSPVRGFSLATPGGRTLSVARERQVVLTDPSNPLSVESMWDMTTVNGRTWGHEYYTSDNFFYDYTPEGRTTEVYLDAKARPARVAVQGIHDIEYTRDALGQLTAITQAGRVTQLGWTSLGELQSITDPLQRTVSFGYDAVGRVISQLLPDSREIRFTYDANGNLTSVTPPSRPPHNFAFTEVDLGESYTPPPESGTGLNLTRYVWNLDKDLTEIVRPDGSTIGFAYDQGGRLQSITSPAGTTSVSYNAVTGMTSGVTAPGGETLAYTWDGVLPLGVTWSGTVSGNVSWAWDNDFRVTSETAAGASVSYEYDDDGLMTSAGPMTLTYHGDNGMLLSTATGGVTESWSYDLFGEMTHYTASYNNAPVFDTVYTRDAVGRITAKQETVGSTTVTDGYGYDTAGRLASVTRDGTVTSTYTYDGNSNRLSHVTGSITNAGTYDTQDRMLTYGGAAYSYTPNGELLQKAEGTDVTLYEYDAMGNLREATLPDGTLIEYVIDGENRRVGKKVNGTLLQGFLYSGALQVVAELDGANNIVSRFVYARGANVPDLMIRGGVTYRIIPDHLGSVRLVVDIATGTIAQQIEYDEFGNVLSDTNPGFQPFGFAGALYDRDTEFLRFGARDYQPQSGRWTAKDPIRFSAGDTNLYGYTFSDPVNWIDPSGLETQVIIWGGSGKGSSSFGHASVIINGTSYSFAPGGMFVSPSGKYVISQGFRWGFGFDLGLTRGQEQLFENYLRGYSSDYFFPTNACTMPIRRGLDNLGFDFTRGRIDPVGMALDLIKSGKVTGVDFYPPTRPADGWTAPWAPFRRTQ